MRQLIKVTRKHIKKGRPGSYRSCPVALAIADVVDCNRPNYPSVSYIGIVVSPSCTAKTPRSVARFIEKFDTYHTFSEVKPFNFYLETKDQ